MGVITPAPNGMARSVFNRSAFGSAVARRSNWHRRYVVWLVVLDMLAALAASHTAVTLFEKADAGFQADPPEFGAIEVFALVVNAGVPLAWLLVLTACGAYDRRALGVGTE